MDKKSYKVKLICGVLFNPLWCEEKFGSSDTVDKINSILLDKLKIFSVSKIDLQSEIIKFDFTDYYNKEMGGEILRYWISFAPLIELNNSYKIKLLTHEVELQQFSDDKKLRKVNLDPGYIEGSKLVLFSTKNYSHRIYLDEGIFAEVTLIYKNKQFHTLNWTYPDYKTALAINFFLKVRRLWCDEQNK